MATIELTADTYAIGHSRRAPQAGYVVAGLLLSQRSHGEAPGAVRVAAAGRERVRAYLAPISKALHRNAGPDGHDYVTDVPVDVPLLEECCHDGPPAVTRRAFFSIIDAEGAVVAAAHRARGALLRSLVDEPLYAVGHLAESTEMAQRSGGGSTCTEAF